MLGVWFAASFVVVIGLRLRTVPPGVTARESETCSCMSVEGSWVFWRVLYCRGIALELFVRGVRTNRRLR